MSVRNNTKPYATALHQDDKLVLYCKICKLDGQGIARKDIQSRLGFGKKFVSDAIAWGKQRTEGMIP